MLEDYDKSLPDLLALLRKEHDELRAELDTELAISQQLENCDQGELEDLRAELEAQTFVCLSLRPLTQTFHLPSDASEKSSERRNETSEV